jgi:SAM-dependent methyltransferase
MNNDQRTGPEMSEESRRDYWDDYYAARVPRSPRLPSQFATFIAGELDRPYRVIELGCGDGRDAIFFALYGHDVLGVDASNIAIEGCRTTAQAVGAGAHFMVARIDEPDLSARIRGDRGPRLVYARFFVHAITENEEDSLLDVARSITDPGDLLAVEYRTVRDSSGAKVTESHYRRYVMPAALEARALGHGFDVTYSVEGFGFAKYKQDDAYVARTVFRRHA